MWKPWCRGTWSSCVSSSKMTWKLCPLGCRQWKLSFGMNRRPSTASDQGPHRWPKCGGNQWRWQGRGQAWAECGCLSHQLWGQGPGWGHGDWLGGEHLECCDVLGLEELYIGWFDSIFAALLMLLNVAMHASFSAILFTRAFMGEELEKKIESARTWRTVSHMTTKHLDLADTSLVSRVCHGDDALILSTTQATMIDHVNSFLGLSKYQFEVESFQPGILLSMLCIILWTLCVYKEFRSIWVQAAIGLSIRRSKKTRFHRNSFRSISFGRLSLLLFTCVARLTIASVLLVAGILWLSRTTSIPKLMLNAVALMAILDVDEFLFVGMSPIKFQEALRKLKPLRVKYSHWRSQCESGVHCSTLVTIVLVAYFALLVPLQQTMLAVKVEMCGGNRTFVVSQNSETQRTIGLVTIASRDVGNDSISEVAVTGS